MARRQLNRNCLMLSDEEFRCIFLLSAFMRDKSGATAIENVLLAFLVSIVILGAVTAIGSEVNRL